MYVFVEAVSVAKSVRLIEPKHEAVVEVVQVFPDEPVKSTLPILGMSWVMVAVPAVVKVAVSWGSGTRLDHVAVDHVAPDTQFVVTGEVNVIPEFPPQSPEPPEIAERFTGPAAS